METDISTAGPGELGRPGRRGRAARPLPRRPPRGRPPPRRQAEERAGAAGGAGWGAWGGTAAGGGGAAWSTADGHRLHLPAERLAAMAERIVAGGGRVSRWIAANPERAALARIERIARQALRVGRLRDRATGYGLPVFGARLGGRAYRILVLPRGPEQGEIVAIRPASPLVRGGVPADSSLTGAGKTHRVRGAHADVLWTGPRPLTQLVNAARVEGDLYVLARRGSDSRDRLPWRPLYVGQTKDFVARWKPRSGVLRELGVDLSAYGVWVGRLSTRPSRLPPAVGTSRMRDGVEHVLIRHINRALKPYGGKLGNPPPCLPAVHPGVVVESAAAPGGTRPPFVPERIRASRGGLYEVEAGPFATG